MGIQQFKSIQFTLRGHKDATITEGRTPFGNRELVMSQGIGGVVFAPDDIPSMIEALQQFAPFERNQWDTLGSSLDGGALISSAAIAYLHPNHGDYSAKRGRFSRK